MRIGNRKSISIIIISVITATVFISLTQATAANAINLSNARETSQAKEWYSMIKNCATHSEAFQRTGFDMWVNNVNITATRLRDGDWFTYQGMAGDWNWGPYYTDYGSPLVEKEVTGSYNDGQFACGDGENTLVKTGIKQILGLDYEDVICNYTKTTDIGSSGWGVLGQGNENATCPNALKDTAGDDEYFRHHNPNAGNYLDNLVKNKVFNGDIPAGYMDSLTYLEQYWVFYDAFTIACATGPGDPILSPNDNHPYKIFELRNGDVVEVGYSARDNPSPETEVIYFYTAKMKCQALATALHEGENVEALREAVAAGEVEEPGSSSNNQEEQNCQNSGGAGSLGWIVCSILDWMSDATEGLYENVVEPALRVEPEIFQGGDSIGAERAWGYFRDFANILFIIIVLAVIFSQLTGVGIDNYGIKKILPKLIIVAILVNLSYLICLLCVDLSNIVGNGVQDLFNNIPTTVNGVETVTVSTGNETSTIEINTNTDHNAGADVGIVAVGVVSAAVGAVAIYTNPALLLTLFVSVLGVLISVLFVFILLAGRKAAIVLLAVISPVAFILYMLPNTKKIFDKWLNLWKAMLIVYPACGLLIGGGNFASKLMLSLPNSSTSAVTIFVAMVVGIVPIFFIPSLIKGAYAALGTIGGAIAGFGGRLSGGATRGMRNSRAYQNTQKRSQDRNQRIRAMRRAGVRLDKDGNVVESRRPTARLRRRIASSDNGFLKFVNRRTGLEASMGQSATEFTKLEAARRGNMAAGNNTDAMNATLAGLAGKESDQRVSDQETLMRAGKVMMGSERLNIDDAKQMESYHRQLLQSANANRAAGNMAGYNSDMDKIKAAQNIMAKSDPGRSSMQRNYQEAIEKGYTGGLSNAASHLKGAHGPDIKAANRAMNSLVEDLAQGVDTASIQNKIDNHTYDIDSISGYNARSLVSADDGALDGLKNSVAAISSMTNENGQNEKRDQLNALIDDALSNKNIQSQPKVKAKLRQIRDDLNRPSGGPYGYDGTGI